MSYQQDFINEIAPIVQKYCKQYGYGVPSAIIAQACLESAYGTSFKAKRHNYFGLKYRPNRVAASNGTFVDDSKEQNEDGSYSNITDKWFSFANMDAGVQGYFQFISITNYDKAKKQTTPVEYLQALKDAGYATSKNYVSSNTSVISKWGLTKYDVTTQTVNKRKGTTKGVTKVTKPLITKLLTKNYASRSGAKIKYIVMHYTGNKTDTAKANANYFENVSGVSAHYIVDETSIYQSVEDANVAWHCGVNYGSNNLFGKCTNRNSIGIEMCSTNGVIAAKTLANAAALVNYLMATYGIPIENVVRHYDVCTKRCPGWSGWLPPNESKWNNFKKLLTKTKATSEVPFLVEVLTDNVNIYKGAGTRYGKTGKKTGKGKFTIVELNKKKTWGKLKSGAGWIYLAKKDKVKKI